MRSKNFSGRLNGMSEEITEERFKEIWKSIMPQYELTEEEKKHALIQEGSSPQVQEYLQNYASYE